MNPYLQIAIGAVLSLIVALLLFAIARKFLTQDRQRDRQSGSDREAKDADKAVIEQARSQLESERKDTARIVEVRAQAEAARLESERKEAASSLEAEQARLAAKVGDLAAKVADLVGNLERVSSLGGNLREALKEVEKDVRAHHAETSLHIDPARDRQIWADFRGEVMRGFERLEEKIERLIHPPKEH